MLEPDLDALKTLFHKYIAIELIILLLLMLQMILLSIQLIYRYYLANINLWFVVLYYTANIKNQDFCVFVSSFFLFIHFLFLYCLLCVPLVRILFTLSPLPCFSISSILFSFFPTSFLLFSLPFFLFPFPILFPVLRFRYFLLSIFFFHFFFRFPFSKDIRYNRQNSLCSG